MTRRHLMTLRLLLALGDVLSAMVVFLAVSVVRFEANPAVSWSVDASPGLLALAFAVIWTGVLWAVGLYRLRVRWSLLAEARDIAKATVVALAVTLSLLFLSHQDNVSRVFLAILFAAQPTAALAIRVLLRRWFEILRRGGRNKTYMVVAGTGSLAQAFADRVERHRSLGIRVIGHLSLPEPQPRKGNAGTPHSMPTPTRPILGTVDEMLTVFHSQIVDEVAVCLPSNATAYLEPIIAIAADEGKTVRVPRDPEEGILTGALQEEFDGFLVRSVIHDGQRDLELAFKRVVDVLVGSLALVVLSPVMLVAALLIRARDGSPVVFSQVRVGRHGRTFTMYKFRTMVADAEDQLPLLASRNETAGPIFKIARDPRITALGRVLRRTSIDELPQLINVIRGDMSLVGPRPAPPREVTAYDIWHRRRLSMRPGMTGLWQVERRTNRDFDERAELDLKYIDQWSIWRDLGILLRTLPAVLALNGK
jgi:exopolysaccharide biosynthesis polyprenyl glycosylphosphotransferase